MRLGKDALGSNQSLGDRNEGPAISPEFSTAVKAEILRKFCESEDLSIEQVIEMIKNEDPRLSNLKNMDFSTAMVLYSYIMDEIPPEQQGILYHKLDKLMGKTPKPPEEYETHDPRQEERDQVVENAISESQNKDGETEVFDFPGTKEQFLFTLDRVAERHHLATLKEHADGFFVPYEGRWRRPDSPQQYEWSLDPTYSEQA